MWGPRCHVCEADLWRAWIHRQAWPRSGLRHDPGYTEWTWTILREWNKWDQLERDPVTCTPESMHVLHLQSALHQQFKRDPRVPHCARNCPGAAHGCQLLRLLKDFRTSLHPVFVSYLTSKLLATSLSLCILAELEVRSFSFRYTSFSVLTYSLFTEVIPLPWVCMKLVAFLLKKRHLGKNQICVFWRRDVLADLDSGWSKRQRDCLLPLQSFSRFTPTACGGKVWKWLKVRALCNNVQFIDCHRRRFSLSACYLWHTPLPHPPPTSQFPLKFGFSWLLLWDNLRNSCDLIRSALFVLRLVFVTLWPWYHFDVHVLKLCPWQQMDCFACILPSVVLWIMSQVAILLQRQIDYPPQLTAVVPLHCFSSTHWTLFSFFFGWCFDNLFSPPPPFFFLLFIHTYPHLYGIASPSPLTLENCQSLYWIFTLFSRHSLLGAYCL